MINASYIKNLFVSKLFPIFNVIFKRFKIRI
jgi:hypothetical protein